MTPLFLLIFGLLLTPALPLHADTALTLDAAIQEATQESPTLKAAQAAKGQARWQSKEAFGAFLPRLSINAHHFFDKKYTETGVNFGAGLLLMPGFYPTDVAAVDATLPLFDGFASIHQYKAASLNADAADQELAHTAFQLKEEIRLAFYRALAAAELRKVAEENVKALEDHLKQAKTRKRGGEATKYDVLRIEVQLNEARADQLDAEDNVVSARRKLAELIGTTNSKKPLAGKIPDPDPEQVRNLNLNSLADRADILALELRSEAAVQSRKAGSAWFVPRISIDGEYSYYNTQMFANGAVTDSGKYNPAYNVGVFLRWNLFDGGISLARAQQAAYQAEKVDAGMETAKLQAPNEFDFWKRRYLSNSDHFKAKRFDIERSLESVRLARLEERAGTRTSTETLDAELDLYRARAGVVNALVNAAEAKIRLELALGREIQ